ncbi:DALR anticodon-binding domain-containing protein 3 [Varanus komodoensis]|uniref:DALR anticodon-binding domain-containing protein 3 isoform X2 n=1 Tax=Varanus komodoensis TaxID=61221 RepID=UPI001CF7A351|nr:DALR anticodon-binding domain-containing protein 3 isoform X2 [Varanus komodoensis]KAF7250053.1 DALR anticodon-binding domain-containing protein 3 [Varanus komodoensis]
METVDSRLSVSATLEALNALLREQAGDGARGSVWFKESSARNLRGRDFLAPQAALRAMFADGQVPNGIIDRVCSLKCPGVPPIQSCQKDPAGLTVQLNRPAVFEQILKGIHMYVKSPQIAHGQSILLNCVPLHGHKGLNSLILSQLRAILVTDHLMGMLQAQGVDVHLVPALADEEIHQFLRQLQVEWPSVLGTARKPEDVLAMKEALRQCPYATFAQTDQDGVVCKLHLKGFLQKQQQEGLEGYDPNIDVFFVTEEKLHHVAELQRLVLQCMAAEPGRRCSVVHVVSNEEAFQQQKVDLLWRLVAPQALAAPQKHLVCGPVRIARAVSPMSVPQYFQLRHSQMYEASVLKYGDLSQDDTWSETVSVLTSAAIRFEMLSTACQNQVLLDVEDTSISTKGTKSGAFVMYNCARLATLFETWQRAAEQGLYPAFPLPSELNYSSLREEGEWLLLFNSILPFQEVLRQGIQLPFSSGGLRVTASTEAICKFLIQLSMDFSSYYNRVHILGEPRPHLFDQMFARLQLMRAVQEVLRSALATLHLPPLSQI